jgi:hypothetical protein
MAYTHILTHPTPLIYMTQSIAAELIIIRIATGSGWTSQTVFELDRPSAYPTMIGGTTAMMGAPHELDISLDLAMTAGFGAVGGTTDRLLKHSRDDSDSVRSV